MFKSKLFWTAVSSRHFFSGGAAPAPRTPYDGVYRLTDGAPVFQAVPAPTPEQLEMLLTRIIKRVLRVLTRKGALIEQVPETPYLADTDRDPALAPLQGAACTYRLALGPRASQKVLTWKDPAGPGVGHEYRLFY